MEERVTVGRKAKFESSTFLAVVTSTSNRVVICLHNWVSSYLPGCYASTYREIADMPGGWGSIDLSTKGDTTVAGASGRNGSYISNQVRYSVVYRGKDRPISP